MNKTAHNRKIEDWFFLELVGIFMLPPVALYLAKQNLGHAHLYVLGLMFLILIIVIVRDKMSLVDLGITKKYLVNGFLPYSIFIFFSILGIKFFAERFGFSEYQNWWTSLRFLGLFIPVSIAQELAYRSFLMPRLKMVFHDAFTVVLVNAGLFAMLHLFYPEPSLVLPLAFAGGLGFATLYYIYPNVWLASFAHILLNFIAVSSGFFAV